VSPPPEATSPPPPVPFTPLLIALPTDDTAPRATVTARRQRLAKTVAVTITCDDEACGATISGSVRVPRVGRSQAKTYALVPATTTIPAATTVTARPALSASARRAIRRALRAGRSVTVALSIRVTDVAGNGQARTRRTALRL
jgi:hypothetical protein